MQIKLKISALLLFLLFAMFPFTAITANAKTFEFRKPSFGLYCENQNADIHGKVSYVIDENGNAVQFSEYTITSDNDLSVYIPFISNAYELPKIDISVNEKAVTGNLCYGESYFYNGELHFYSSEIDDNLSGTLYTLTAENDSFTVNFKTLEKQNFIYRFTDCYTQNYNGDYSYIINNAQPAVTYEIFVINGDFAEFESNAQTTKETLTLKKYIDRNFSELNDFYSACENIGTEFFYSLANEMLEKNVNYDFYDFFLNSFTQMRLNAYKIEIQTPCTIFYSLPVELQINNEFKPAVYTAEQTATGKYNIDYTIELNGKFPFIIESSAEIKKQCDYIYTAENITDDFYFVFSSKHQSMYSENKPNTLRIILYVILGLAVCALIGFSILIILYYKKTKKQ